MEKEEIKYNGKIFFSDADLPVRSKLAVNVLTNLIRAMDERIAPDEQYNKNRNEATDDLLEACEHAFQDQTPKVFVYGSCINGFGSKNSDVDCFVMTRCNLNNKASYFNPMLREIRSNRKFSLLHSVRRAKVPIITIKHNNGIEMDVSFASDSDPKEDVLENSALLNSYAQSSEKITAVGRFLKFVLSCEPVYGTAKMSGLSSYSHVIMFLYFLLHSKYKAKHVKVQRPMEVFENEITQPEGEIFLDFLKFYACEFDSSKNAVDIRPEQVTKVSAGNTTIWTIEDPIVEKNLGKTMPPGRTYEMKLFYYNLLVKLSDHRMNEECLLKEIEQGIPITEKPAINPLAKPDKADKKQQNKKQERRDKKKKAKGQEGRDGESGPSSPNNTKPDPKSITKTIENKPTGDSAKKQRTKKQGTSSSEGDIVVINDESLDQMMGELKIEDNTAPKKERKSVNSIMEDNFTKLTVKPDWKVAYYSTQGRGCGDNRSLLVIPILSALGLKVPGLLADSTGTPLEKLKCIPGFRSSLSVEEMNNLLETVGCFIATTKVEECPSSSSSDPYQDSQTPEDPIWKGALIGSTGAQFVMSDVSCSTGKDAVNGQKKLLRGLRNALDRLEVSSVLELSDGKVPLGNSFGYCLELSEVMQALGGIGSQDLISTVTRQCAILLTLSKHATTATEADKQVREVMESGAAIAKFYELLAGQGVSSDTISALKDKKDVLKLAPETTLIKATSPGTITGCTTESVERVLRGLGGYGASGNGLKVLVEAGDRVTTGTPLLRVYHSNPISPKLMTAVKKMIPVEKKPSRVIFTLRNDLSARKQRAANAAAAKEKKQAEGAGQSSAVLETTNAADPTESNVVEPPKNGDIVTKKEQDEASDFVVVTTPQGDTQSVN